MQFKLLATLLLSSTALVSANDAAMTASVASSGSSETNPDSGSMSIPGVPQSILTVLETAIPKSWYSDILQPKFRSSIESEIMAGTLPAWYNNLPQSVKAWASSEGGMIINNLTGAEPTSASVGAASSNAPASGAPAHNTASTMSTAAATTTGTGGSGGSGASATTTSGTKKSSPSSSTSISTGGAPIATGGVAASIAGVAGILGLALAL